jgi:hypothetical protein
MGESALKRSRKRISDLETELLKLMIELATEKDLVSKLVAQVEALVVADLRRRNRRSEEAFEWYD